jgi:diacylglycerol kinase (ATP)
MAGFRNVFAETSFRYELLLVVLHVMAVLIIELTALEILLTTITLVMLLVTEMINTAIESVVDLVTSEKQPLAARAKDIGSAAVFSCIVLFIIAWVVVICGE